MNAGEFGRRRARIEVERHSRSKGYAAKALQALVREAGAVIIIRRGKVVGWRMKNGQEVCRKRRYHTEAVAMLELANVHSAPKARYVPIRCYLCDHCSGWHLTSQRPEVLQ